MVRTDLGNREQALEDYLGDYEGAISDYTDALKINPKSTTAYSNRGNSKYRKGDKSGACDDWKKALELGDKDAQSKLDQYCK